MDRLNVLSIGLTAHSSTGDGTVEFHDLFLQIQSADTGACRFVSIPVKEVEALMLRTKKVKLEDNQAISLPDTGRFPLKPS